MVKPQLLFQDQLKTEEEFFSAVLQQCPEDPDILLLFSGD